MQHFQNMGLNLSRSDLAAIMYNYVGLLRGRSKPGCRILGSVAIVSLTTEVNNQISLYCAFKRMKSEANLMAHRNSGARAPSSPPHPRTNATGLTLVVFLIMCI